MFDLMSNELDIKERIILDNYQWQIVRDLGNTPLSKVRERKIQTLLFRKSLSITMGSRMNPDRKIYIGGLPNDANKYILHNFTFCNCFCFFNHIGIFDLVELCS